MPLVTSLLLLIVVSRLLGQLFLKLKQPEIVGEMLAGVLLGPAVLSFVHPSAALSGISELAVFLIVLSAGLEMNFADIITAFRGKGLLVGILGFVIPLFTGILLGIAFQLGVMRSVFLGLAVSISALPVTVRLLDSFQLLKSEIARYCIGAAIFSDIAALLALGVVLDVPTERTFSAAFMSILQTGGKLVLLAAIIMGVNSLLKWIQKRGIHLERGAEKLVKLFGSEALFGIVIVFVLAFGSASEILGFHFVIGAFFGALLIDKEFFLASRYSELEKVIGSITGGFLGPIFFAYLGLQFDVGAMTSVGFTVLLILASIGSKILAGWLSGKVAGIPPAESLGIGIILNGRGVMGLVIASIAFERNFIGKGLFSSLVLMSIVTTVVAPIMFRRFVLKDIVAKEPIQA